MKLFFRFFLAAILFHQLNAILQAQEEPKWEQLKENFKTEALSFGALLQIVGDFQPERSFGGNTGFNISNMRISLQGALDSGFGYFLQTNFIKSPAILDARLSYRVSSGFGLDAGLFKAPFSAEFLIPASSIDFVNRSQVVSLLTPGRQIGVQARGGLAGSVATYSAGIFNGNNFGGNNNDNNNFLYVARLTFFPARSESVKPLEFGMNVGYSRDANVDFPGGVLNGFSGKRLLYGGDFRWASKRGFLSGEVIGARLQSPGSADIKPLGFQITAGRMLDAKNQVLLRWDRMDFDGIPETSDLIILGYNLWPTSATEVQVNYIIDARDTVFKHHQLLINVQVGF